jgi:formamidopyrimidine-DNA glycosylase
MPELPDILLYVRALQQRLRLQLQEGDRFPERVTAFRDEMAVHGKFGSRCPQCNAPIQRIRYADNECNYCPGCQTEGRILADRSLSRLLKDDWPRSLDELE